MEQPDNTERRTLQKQRVDEFIVHTELLSLWRNGIYLNLKSFSEWNFANRMPYSDSIDVSLVFHFTPNFSWSIVRNSYPPVGFGHAIVAISPNVGILLRMQAYHWHSRNIFLHFIVGYTPLRSNDEQLSLRCYFPRNIVSFLFPHQFLSAGQGRRHVLWMWILGFRVKHLYRSANLVYTLPLHRATAYVFGVGLGVLLRYTGKELRIHKVFQLSIITP